MSTEVNRVLGSRSIRGDPILIGHANDRIGPPIGRVPLATSCDACITVARRVEAEDAY